MTTRTNRARNLKATLGTMPLRHDVLRDAYAEFRATGVLPDHVRLAQAVVESAIAGELQTSEEASDSAAFLRIVHQLKQEREAGPRERTLREYLLDHAGYAPDPLRTVARLACTVLARRGVDLTDRMALADEPLPDHNGIGWHVLGYPEKLVAAPHEERARRLLLRCAALRDRVDEEDDAWMANFTASANDFYRGGDVPTDDLVLDALLADLEINWLFRRAAGEDIAYMEAVLQRVAATTGQERNAAILEVQAMIVARCSAEDE